MKILVTRVVVKRMLKIILRLTFFKLMFVSNHSFFKYLLLGHLYQRFTVKSNFLLLIFFISHVLLILQLIDGA